MTDTLVNPADPPERQRAKLMQIVEVLMRRVEQATDDGGAAYAQFQRAVMLEDQVRQRTSELEHALDLLNESNALLAETMREAEAARQNLADAIETVQEGFALFDQGERLVMCNTRFCTDMMDIHDRLQPGLTFSDYVTMVSQSAHLSLPEGETPGSWAVRRMRRHADDHVIFNVSMTGDRWIQVSEHRTRDGGTVILQTDVTDIIRLERVERGRLLDDQAQMIRATLEHINQGVCIFDAEGMLVGWNQHLGKLLTAPASHFHIGASFDTLVHVLSGDMRIGDGLTAADLIDWARSGTGRTSLSFELTRTGGQVLAVFAQEMPDGGFVMSFSDITPERRAMQAIREANETLEQRVTDRTEELAEALNRAERANASRSRFVAAASHDLLQPLSAAKLYLASISDETLTTPARTTLEKAQNALTGVEGILDALLDISKLETGHASVDVKPVEIGPMLKRLNEDFAPGAAQKGLELVFGESAAVVESDRTYLRRILQNLISNAIRYTEAGSVRVTAQTTGGSVRISVTDTGPGIPEHEQQVIFREFHRLNARASAADGMGLGLAIVERACSLLGHPIEIQSKPGEGACFSVTLPVASRTLAAESQEGARARSPVATGPATIVCLVENDADLRGAMTQLLEKWGFDVVHAASGEETLVLLDEIDILPDCFLVDLQLGEGMDGLDLIAELRRKHGKIKARIITADRDPAIGRRCAAEEIGVFWKPINAEELSAFIEVG